MRALTMRWVCKPAAALALWCGTQVCLAQTAVVTVVDSGTGGDVGRKISGTLVAGNPAVCYADSINRTLVFARNATASGLGAWAKTNVYVYAGAPLHTYEPFPDTSLATIASNPAVAFVVNGQGLFFARCDSDTGSGAWTTSLVQAFSGSYALSTAGDCSLAEIGGAPCIAFRDPTSRKLKFARNSLADGSGAWSVVEADREQDSGSSCSLAEIGGLPAIAYQAYVNYVRSLRFARNTQADGLGLWQTWEVREGQPSQMAVDLREVGGVPCISCYGTPDGGASALLFVRCATPDGSGAWTTAVVAAYAPLHTSLEEVNGRPAIAFLTQEGGTGTVRYARTDDTNGVAGWSVATVASVGASRDPISLFKLASGRPAVAAYRETTCDARLAVNANPYGTGIWVPVVIDAGSGGDAGQQLSHALVQGHPAVAYLDRINRTVKFARNTSAAGTGTWTTAVIGPASPTGVCSLAQVAGNPCILFADLNSTGLVFARNSAADGSGSWVTSGVPFGSSANTGVQLADLGGRPAFAYRRGSSVWLVQNYAADASQPWTAQLVDNALDHVGDRLLADLRTVQNRAALWYVSDDYDSRVVRYRLNSLADGFGVWSATNVLGYANYVSGVSGASVTGTVFTSLVNYSGSGDALVFCRSAASNGLGTWSSSTIENASVIEGHSLAVVAGFPTLAYPYDDPGYVRYAVSTSSVGVGTWTRTTLDTNSAAGSQISLLQVNGKPGIAYYDELSTALKWLTLSEAPATPDLAVELASGAALPDDGVIDYGALAVGSNATRVLILRNTGTALLNGIAASVSGPDAAMFTVLGAPSANLAPGGTTGFSLRFQPSAAGERRATLTIVSSDPNESPYEIALQGRTPAPEMAVFLPDTTHRLDGETNVSPFSASGVPVGTTSTTSIVVYNVGSDTLTGLTVTVDGPHAALFSVTGSLANLPAGSNRTFTLSFVPDSFGYKTAAVHLVSNDTDESPFDLGLRAYVRGPVLAVEYPAGSALSPGATLDLGSVMVGGGGTTRVLTLRNPGNEVLTNLAFSLTGSGVGQFAIAGQPADNFLDYWYGTTNVTVSFVPTGTGVKTAALHIASSDPLNNPFVVNLLGTGLTPGSLVTNVNPGVTGGVAAIAIQPDGKVILAGSFTNVSGQARNRIARLLPDGTLEPTNTFAIGVGADAPIQSVALQTDGRIVIGGSFTSFNGQALGRIARLNADGTVESSATFNPGTGANSNVLAVALQADGKILLGGDFTNFNAQGRTRIARLETNGAVEATGTFNPGSGANAAVRALAVQADGRILLGGDFTTVNASNRSRVARLSASGVLENTATFNGSGASGTVRCIAIQSDGKILLGGDFTNVQGTACGGIARLLTNGVVESTGTFNPGSGAGSNVYALALQADGRVLVAGAFSTFNGTVQPRLVELRTNGTVETNTLFDIGSGADAPIAAVALANSGNILVGGSFSNFNGAARRGYAQLVNIPAVSTLDVSSRLRVRWMRSGGAPELSDVTFDLSTNNGVAWTSLGAPTRITGGWERADLLLPPTTGVIRVRGRAPAGQGNAGAGLVEQTSNFRLIPSIYLSSTVPLDYYGAIVTPGILCNTTSAPVTFTISNSGYGELTGIHVSLSGVDASYFRLGTSGVPATIAARSNASFTVAFAGGPVTASRTATLDIANDDPDDGPVLSLDVTGSAYSPSADTDGDGMTDWAEYTLHDISFNNWGDAYYFFDAQRADPASVSAFNAAAQASGLVSTSALQAMNLDALILTRDLATGQFLLTFGVEQANSPNGVWTNFPLTVTQSVINAQGKLEFRFTLPNTGTVFRLQAQ